MKNINEETYLKRKIDIFLIEWKKDPDRYPLIISGCRQIGKTQSIRHFAELAKYKSFIEINFAIQDVYKKIIKNGYDVDSIIKNISLIDSSKKFVPGNTLILFDEITEFPEIATSLKSFKEDGRFDVICSGSLLGINYKKIESNSVGYKQDYHMFSMDFEEFLWSRGYCDAAENMLSHMRNMAPFSGLEMDVYFDLFTDYIILGGMPAVVRKNYLTGTFEDTLSIQNQLILDFKEDIRKHAGGLDQARLMSVFESIPSQLAKENKKFQMSKISHGAKFEDYRGCVEWLSDSGIINVCHCLNFPELPISGNYNFNKFKLYFADTGLLVSLLDEESQLDLKIDRNLGVYKGALYENAIGEALKKSGYRLAYYRRDDSSLEEDFFIRTQNSLVPIEVKAQDGNAKSQRTLIESTKYPDIRFGIKLSKNNIGHANKVYTFPYFCAFLLKTFMEDFKASEE